MTEYKKPEWAVQQLYRASGLLEDICKHGVGHPNKEFLEKNPQFVKNGFGVHGCDGCCDATDKKMKSIPFSEKALTEKRKEIRNELLSMSGEVVEPWEYLMKKAQEGVIEDLRALLKGAQPLLKPQKGIEDDMKNILKPFIKGWNETHELAAKTAYMWGYNKRDADLQELLAEL